MAGRWAMIGWNSQADDFGTRERPAEAFEVALSYWHDLEREFEGATPHFRSPGALGVNQLARHLWLALQLIQLPTLGCKIDSDALLSGHFLRGRRPRANRRSSIAPFLRASRLKHRSPFVSANCQIRDQGVKSLAD